MGGDSSGASSAKCIMELHTTELDGKEKVSKFECGAEQLDSLLGEFDKIEKAVKINAGGGGADA